MPYDLGHVLCAYLYKIDKYRGDLLAGLFLAGVYPVGMKVIATWTKADHGLGIALLALGPLLGILAMVALRLSPVVAHLAGGRG